MQRTNKLKLALNLFINNYSAACELCDCVPWIMSLACFGVAHSAWTAPDAFGGGVPDTCLQTLWRRSSCPANFLKSLFKHTHGCLNVPFFYKCRDQASWRSLQRTRRRAERMSPGQYANAVDGRFTQGDGHALARTFKGKEGRPRPKHQVWAVGWKCGSEFT